jgi:ATP-dependent Clp protease ATP-binding subunit ClpC
MRVVALAAEEANGQHHTYVGTEHVLLGLLREGDGVAVRLLAQLGVKPNEMRQEILRELNPSSTV